MRKHQYDHVHDDHKNYIQYVKELGEDDHDKYDEDNERDDDEDRFLIIFGFFFFFLLFGVLCRTRSK